MKIHLSLLCVLFIGLLTFSSCKDPVQGCTNVNAENYDSEAEESDNSCVFARDKFLNVYTGTLLCSGVPGIPTESQFILEISEGLSGDNSIQIEFKDTSVPIPVMEGTVSGNTITVEQTSYMVPLDENNPDVLTEVQISTVATYQSETEVTGELVVELVGIEFPPCTYIATKI